MPNCPHCATVAQEHEAGRCLDAWVAEAVMGIEVRISEDALGDFLPVAEDIFGSYYAGGGGKTERPLSLYSTNIADAWEVVEHLRLETTLKWTSGWWCWIGDAVASAVQAPLAICRVALEACDG